MEIDKAASAVVSTVSNIGRAADRCSKAATASGGHSAHSHFEGPLDRERIFYNIDGGQAKIVQVYHSVRCWFEDAWPTPDALLFRAQLYATSLGEGAAIGGGVGATVGSSMPVIGTAFGAIIGGELGLGAGFSAGNDYFKKTKAALEWLIQEDSDHNVISAELCNRSWDPVLNGYRCALTHRVVRSALQDQTGTYLFDREEIISRLNSSGSNDPCVELWNKEQVDLTTLIPCPSFEFVIWRRLGHVLQRDLDIEENASIKDLMLRAQQFCEQQAHYRLECAHRSIDDLSSDVQHGMSQTLNRLATWDGSGQVEGGHFGVPPVVEQMTPPPAHLFALWELEFKVAPKVIKGGELLLTCEPFIQLQFPFVRVEGVALWAAKKYQAPAKRALSKILPGALLNTSVS